MDIEIKPEVDVSWWDGLIAGSETGMMFDTASWAECLKKAMYVRPYYAVIREGNAVKALAVIEGRSIAHNRFYEKPFDNILLPFLTKHAAVLRMRDFVFLDNGFKKEFNRKEFAMKLDAALKNINPVSVEMVKNALSEKDNAAEDALTEAGFARYRWATFLVDLKRDMGEIVKLFKSSARKALRKAEEQGLEVDMIKNEEELKQYHSFFRRSRKEFLKEWSPSFNFMRTMWRELRKPGSHFEIFVAKHEGKVAGGLGVWGYNGVISEYGAIRSLDAFNKGLFTGDVLKYRIIEWAHSKGFKYYDLMGVSPDPVNSKDIAIRQFKEKWGGELRNCDIFRKTYSENSIIAPVISLIKNIKEYRNKKRGLSIPR